MSTIPLKPPAELALQLITHYSFDLGGYKPHDLITLWQSEYAVNWLHLAVIEALYQGRYKAVSVQQILNFWQRKGEATYHFNMEFERMICSKFPQRLTAPSLAVLPTLPQHKPVTQKVPVIEKNSVNRLLPAQISNHGSEAYIASTDIENIKYNTQYHIPAQDQLVVNVSNESNSVIEKQPQRQSYQPYQPRYQANCQPVNSGGGNHPPIGQFTPQKSDRIESFTSKLKAMTMENLEFAF
ncbi:hypothetical protein H6F32_05470 [Anabaena sp. FACHB-1237]|uniref:hypothetical protein n=1 Tax=Anabaena sp. FACHB-1237 TaxID=2692769 RepID=UPI001681914D|nr:hypothetical protein [Anabaena sp. FACHB-1237]MBD2137045.1 hypothetical protein [Anabaena sp. FACHB-1237]